MTRFEFPVDGKQIYVAAFLARVRETGLHDALNRGAQKVSGATLRQEMGLYAPAAGLQLLQGTRVRDEEVFAIPSLLREEPGVLAYYRLLLGASQKQFYTTKSGLNVFKPMEERQEITAKAAPLIEAMCSEMNEALGVLIHALPQASLREDVDQLPLLTLGSQADGSWRGQIGQKATTDVFEAMKAIVKGQSKQYAETEVSITVVNNSNREVTLALAPDPDVVIREDVSGELVYKAAIEIKGGSDYANIHNRAGEAEKSHQKARSDGAGDCWTVINLDRADMDVLKQESPTTRHWLDLNDVLNHSGGGWRKLKTLTISAMGI